MIAIDKQRRLRHICYNIALSNFHTIKDEHTKKEVQLLINQFHYGVDAQNDLLKKCIELGWIKE